MKSDRKHRYGVPSRVRHDARAPAPHPPTRIRLDRPAIDTRGIIRTFDSGRHGHCISRSSAEMEIGSLDNM